MLLTITMYLYPFPFKIDYRLRKRDEIPWEINQVGFYHFFFDVQRHSRNATMQSARGINKSITVDSFYREILLSIHFL